MAAKISLPSIYGQNRSDQNKTRIPIQALALFVKKISVLAHREEELEAPVIDYGLLQGPGLLPDGLRLQLFIGRAQEFTNLRKIAREVRRQPLVAELQEREMTEQGSGFLGSIEIPLDVERSSIPLSLTFGGDGVLPVHI